MCSSRAPFLPALVHFVCSFSQFCSFPSLSNCAHYSFFFLFSLFFFVSIQCGLRLLVFSLITQLFKDVAMCTLAMRENQPGQPCADVVQSDCHGATSPVIEMNTNRQKVTVNRTNCQVLAASYRRKNSCIKTSSLRSSETDPRRNAKKFH